MLKKMSQETLEAIRQEEWIHGFVTNIAEKKLADLSLDGGLRVIKVFKNEFESCFATIIEDDGDCCCDKVCALRAIKVAAVIMALSGPQSWV